MKTCIMTVVIFGAILLFCYAVWRYYWFFRDPERIIPFGDNIVSPADGSVVYIKEFRNGFIPASVKNGEAIPIKEILKQERTIEEGYLIGIWMSPFDVHVNRAPISGMVRTVDHFKNKNLSMWKIFFQIMFQRLGIIRAKDHFSYKDHPYIIQNERNIFLIEGDFRVYVIQIADKMVNKVVAFVQENERVQKGQRIGIIKMGSQVDILIPKLKNIKMRLMLGERVYAGETIVADF